MFNKITMRLIHKWLGLLTALQLLFWVLSGLIMASLPLEKVRGQHTQVILPTLALSVRNLVPLAQLLNDEQLSISEAKIERSNIGVVYRLKTLSGVEKVYLAYSGEPVKMIDEARAITIAKQRYDGDGDISGVRKIHQNSTEYKGAVPAWRVEFDDTIATTLYLSASNGDLLATRNLLWRIFDFVWMLHIMDYQEREDFNSPLLIIAASISLLFCISGFLLLSMAQYKNDLQQYRASLKAK